MVSEHWKYTIQRTLTPAVSAAALEKWYTPKPVPCCDWLIGLTPAGHPITWHAKDCPEFESRILGALLAEPTGTNLDLAQCADNLARVVRASWELRGALRKLCLTWALRSATRGLGSDSYRQGAADTWSTAVGELGAELTANRTGDDHG